MFPQLVALFFEDPRCYRSPPGQFGILYLLRRDINICLGAEGGMANRSSRKIQWPGAMAIFAGSDLLAKFLAGEDGPRVSNRFREFVRRYFHLSALDCEVIYQLRNSLLHSFGLYSQSKVAVYRFRLEACGGRPLVRQLGPEIYCADVITLHECFEQAVGEYQQDLLADQGLQQNFMAMFPNYGAITIG